MPKYAAWDDYGDPQCPDHGFSQPCHRCEEDYGYGDDQLKGSLAMQAEERSAGLMARLITLIPVVPQPRLKDLLDATILVQREPKLWTLAERLESHGELKIAQELRKLLEFDYDAHDDAGAGQESGPRSSDEF